MTTHKTEPFWQCPRADHCSVNHCPLDPEQDRHQRDPGDSQPRCTMERGVRVRISNQFPGVLPLGGLKLREFNGIKRMANMTPEAKAALAQSGRQALERLHSKPTVNRPKPTENGHPSVL